MKRAFDFCAALAGLILLSPLLAVIACAVCLEDRHSPLFFGRRVAGSGGRREHRYFHMVKFRTMIPDAWRKIGRAHV